MRGQPLKPDFDQFFAQFRPEGHRETSHEVGSLIPADRWQFSDSKCNGYAHWTTLSVLQKHKMHQTNPLKICIIAKLKVSNK